MFVLKKVVFTVFAGQQPGLVNSEEVKTTDQGSKLLCSPDLQEWGRPPQRHWSVRSVWKRTFPAQFVVVLLRFPLHLCICVVWRSCASVTWRWTPAAPAAKTVWRKWSQSRWTTPVLKISTKVIHLLTVSKFFFFPSIKHVKKWFLFKVKGL